MKNYYDIANIVLDEHRKVLLDVDSDQVEMLIDKICEADSIQIFGQGRMYCSAKAFAMRLMHMGFDVHVVFETTCPNLKKEDLLIANGPCTSVYETVMKLAKQVGATVCSISPHKDDKYSDYADFTVLLRGQMAPGAPGVEIPSIQPMASLFEQTIFVFEDIIIQMLMERCGITARMMEERHTNLDGYLSIPNS